MINIKYQGRMFPKAVLFNGRRKVVFHPDRKIVSLDMDDALFLLSQNRQVNRGTWEFVLLEAGVQSDILKEESPIIEEAPKKKTKKSKKED